MRKGYRPTPSEENTFGLFTEEEMRAAREATAHALAASEAKLTKLSRTSKRTERFLPAPPFGWEDCQTIAKLHATDVILQLALQAKLRSTTTGLTVPPHILRNFGIGQSQYRRTLLALEQAGFVRLTRARGQLPRIDLLRSLLAFAPTKSKLN